MTVMLSRRSFIQAGLSAAGGLVIVALAPEFAGATTISGEPWSPETGKAPDEVNAFVVIDPDNSITLRVAKSEMGQGVLTSMAMIVAEELECDFAKVKVEYASANRNLTDNNVYQSMGTGGSSSVRRSRVFLQQAGASARARLVAAAAARWGVEPAGCVANRGLVQHAASGRTATFGELAPEAAKVALAAEPAIKTPDQFKLIGESLKRIDTPLKVTGAARFGIDTRLPGMAYAAAANCPVFGGKLKSYDFSAISGRRGIIAAMPVTNGVAVVADNFWRAKEALHAMPVEWDFGPAASTDSAGFAAEYRAALEGPLADGGGHGDIAAAFVKPAKVVEALYEVPYLAHAPMEPLNATAHWRGDRIDVWMGTQAPEAALALAAKAGGVDPKAVFVHNCFLGGGFGRRAVNDELTQAVEVSRALNRPIKLIWTREEDIRSDRYRPQAALKMRAALGADGSPAGFDFATAVGSITRSLGWGKVENGVERQAVEGLANCPYRAGGAQGRGQPQEHPCAGHVLALRRLVAERLRRRELHRRMRACGQARSARIPARAARRPARFPRRPRQARLEGRLGQAHAERRRTWGRDPRGLRHHRRRDRRGRGQRARRRQGSSASSPASTAAISSIRSPPRCRSRARCSTA